MKRDLDLIRKILQIVEECDNPNGIGGKLTVPGYDDSFVSYHIKLLMDAGLVEAVDACTLGPNGYLFIPKNLTWEGHEFLDASRDEKIWKKAKEWVIKEGSSFAFGALLEWLKSQARLTIGVPI